MIPIGNGFRVLACALALSPGVARAQATVRPFDELQTLLRPETLVVVTDDTGSETRGRVKEVSATSLTIVEVEWRQNGPLWEVHPLGTIRQFERSRVVEVARLSSSGGKSASLYRRSQGFGDLRFSLKPGTRVVLVDRTGHKTSGTVAEVSPTSLVLTTRGAASGAGLERLQQVSARQNTFAQSLLRATWLKSECMMASETVCRLAWEWESPLDLPWAEYSPRDPIFPRTYLARG